ncbi:MBL fold metallo-hydrolase [Methylophilus medardicus]|uniref:MBL fold metallo-hydrolase n=1 Tax=Methylophilus medardicus TaxID=2588534 RepID=A0A5B8CR31_9PROT|nr:MBL fold metallo-hydrolase [Methylophilus medardicus]QDC43486.1 MBL fold metallo-hydrolase [Methylophilus medardicus]QDC48493.1 MBL fold metallo-hydrolase [Methylophilus medardicus]QDC52198.1 MBL fold metallo-hydrolase [Methylophilus medardicus]
MQFASLGSGSAGNATLIEAGETRLLLDCGFSVKETVQRLARLQRQPEQLTGILVTHEHDDHARGAFKLAARYQIPVWLTHGTLSMCQRYLPAASQSVKLNIVDAHTVFALQEIEVHPYPVPHDAREPAQFVFSDGVRKFGVLTDVGSVTPHIVLMLQACDGLLLECNHDLEMLRNGPYAYSLKKRVGGWLGHLDNQSSAQLLAKLDNRKLKHLVAAHLSEKNNTPTLAQQALSEVLHCERDWVQIASQQSGLDWRSLI